MSTKEDIFTYIMNTPGNTNPAVLESLLDNLEDSGESIPPHNIVNITNNSSGNPTITGTGLVTPEGVIGSEDGVAISIQSGNSRLFLYSLDREDDYLTKIIIYAEADLYSIVVNNTQLTYDGKDDLYAFFQISETEPITGQTYNVVITDKE